MKVEMKEGVEMYLESMLRMYGKEVVERMCKKFNLELEEGMEVLKGDGIKVSVKEVKEKESRIRSKIPLPFCGEKCIDNCNAIRLNHGLYTQCQNESNMSHTYGSEIVELCKTCFKQIEKNSNGKPTYGYIDERISKGDDFRDPKGKAPVQYGNVMEKLNISRKEAEAEAKKLGLTIPEYQFDVKKTQRGRPKKDTTAVDTSGSEASTPKKPRGRPRKEKQTVTAETGDDIIKSLVQQVQQPTTSPPKIEPAIQTKPDSPIKTTNNTSSDDSDSSDDEEELAVCEILYKGQKYLKAADNTVYDHNTHEEIGMWNPSTKSIAFEIDDD